jgi:3-hydroxymyristoyl/3-hydroxydecanoyl-(acyl carrier protein) dehydratase
MKSVLEILAQAPPQAAWFIRPAGPVNASGIRAAARRAMAWAEASEGDLYLHASSAAMICAGLLAAAAMGRRIVLLPHVQPAFLEEAGVDRSRLLTDSGPGAPLSFADGDGAPFDLSGDTDLEMVFLTSGSTGQPKRVLRRISQLDREVAYWASVFAPRVDNVASTVAHQHMYGFTFAVLLPVFANWRAADDPAFTWEDLSPHLSPSTLAVTSPAHLLRIPLGLALPHGAPAVVLSAGQLLPLTAACAAADVFGDPPLEILGSTETGSVACRQRRDDAVPWNPLPGAVFSLGDDETLEVVTPFIGADIQRMGDRAELLADGRFHLKGRADRVVKIAGNRVSFTRVEEALCALPGITAATAVAIPTESDVVLGAAVVLNAEAGAELARAGAFRMSRELRRLLADQLHPAERPKRWRFVGCLPVNAQGKHVAGDIARLFDTPSLLQDLNASVELTGDNAAQISFVLSPGISYFDGHFPGQPVLAGVAQVHFAVRLAEEVWGFLPSDFNVTRLKFRHILQPGDSVILTLTRDAPAARLSFKLSRDGETASEGVVGGK